MFKKGDHDIRGTGFLGIIGVIHYDQFLDLIPCYDSGHHPCSHSIGEHTGNPELTVGNEPYRSKGAFLDTNIELGTVLMLDFVILLLEINHPCRGTSVPVIDGDVDISVFRKHFRAHDLHYAFCSGYAPDCRFETSVGTRNQHGIICTRSGQGICDGDRIARIDEHQVSHLKAI